MPAPFVSYVTRSLETTLESSSFPGNLPFIRDLKLDFNVPVTFFVGENGSGKSTLLEAIAVLAGFPISGGSANEMGDAHGLNEQSALSHSLRLGFRKRPKDGYFFRAELQAHFASLLDERRKDPHFLGDPYQIYGGRSLHTMSHGEAFLSIMKNRFSEGLFLLDEPESALSPQRQLTLLAIMHDLASHGTSQFLVATHSAILLTYPDAQIISFDEENLPNVALEETSHYQITRGILSSPGSYWKHLTQSENQEG